MRFTSIVRSLVVLLVCMLAARARAATGRRLALVTSDPELTRSVSIALTPWGVETVPMVRDSLGSSLPEAAERAAGLAREHHFDAVVWISASAQASVLWVYDADSADVSTRVFSGAPPLPSSVAASVALSLKTLLRATVVAPEAERFGATSQAAARPARLVLQSGVDLRFLAADSQEFRFAVAGLWWLHSPPKGFGVAFELSAGPGVTVANDRFAGRFRDIGFAPFARWQIAATDRVAVALSAGPTGHLTVLDGTLVSTGASVAPRRFNVTLDAGALVDFTPAPGLHLGATARGSYLVVSRRYLVNGDPVFELWPIAVEIGARIGLDIL